MSVRRVVLVAALALYALLWVLAAAGATGLVACSRSRSWSWSRAGNWLQHWLGAQRRDRSSRVARRRAERDERDDEPRA